MHRNIARHLTYKTSWVKSEAGKCTPFSLNRARVHWSPRETPYFIENQAGPTIVDNHGSTVSATMDMHHLLPGFKCISHLGSDVYLDCWSKLKKRKLTKLKARFKFWPPLESVCFSACTWAFSLNYWQTLTFQKLSLFAAFKTVPRWLSHKFSGPFTPSPNRANKTVLCEATSSCLFLQSNWNGLAVTFSFEILSLIIGLSTQGQDLAGLIFSSLFSFNNRNRCELLAMTPTYLELSVSSNHC